MATSNTIFDLNANIHCTKLKTICQRESQNQTAIYSVFEIICICSDAGFDQNLSSSSAGNKIVLVFLILGGSTFDVSLFDMKKDDLQLAI